jgi:hypothetical protein
VPDQLVQQQRATTKWYVVLRPFVADGVERVRKEVVDVTAWPRTRVDQLVEMRRIYPLSAEQTLPELVHDEELGRDLRRLGVRAKPDPKERAKPKIVVEHEGGERKVRAKKE